MLSFSIHLRDDKNKEIEFNSGEQKISILNFQTDVFLRWAEELDRIKHCNKEKKNKLIFLLEDVEKILEEYKKALEIKDKQLSDIKKILITTKKGTIR